MARHKFPLLHPWKISSEQAKQIQTDLRRLVITVDEIDDIRAVAGVDVGFLDNNATALAAVVVLTPLPNAAFNFLISRAIYLFEKFLLSWPR